MKRSQFIKSAGLGALLIPSASVFAANWKNSQDDDQLDKAMVQKFVGAAHSKMDVVKEMLEEQPNLINAAHDWKHGDFETGLGAASHVGYKELAQYFLDHGAQANIFTAALFGRIDIVKPMIEFSPSILNARGPHGFTLLHHAEKGKEEAEAVKEYLLSLGLKETKVALY
ncbi:MAG: ankyrin repeat domain-containing protein [Flavobacteriaceae bacterium]|nr:ankyrin repeat domain-containing protein [Flavobacteriaceae bacterium]